MGLQTGKLNRLVTLKSRSISRDGYGDAVESFSTLAQVWAQWGNARGSERVSAGQDLAAVEAAMAIRFRSDVSTSMRVEYSSTEWEITSVSEMGRREGLYITVKAIGAAAAPASSGLKTFAGDSIKTFAGDNIAVF